MNWNKDRIAISIRTPWHRYNRKYEAHLQIRFGARQRWRWYEIVIHSPRHLASKGGVIFSLTMEARTWLSDQGLRGNLRHKAFFRWQIKGGGGGTPNTGSYCPVLGPKDKRCTWVRGHLPMHIEWEEKRRPGRTISHSWACPPLKGAIVTQQPRRNSDS